ncbi:metallophosphoesterase [Desulfopila sp. IMCC35006]|uniref:metallophosphoesterase family protein n=1 Tax=Desulfopila sp. IMCC35006 TaxID=2569542 RepID=UPI00142ECDE3|nr:metallophosphoesterase family protein [Desulfopila sp. IMCC35006]
MKVAVLADIHGNLEAFEAVTADLRRQGADRVICLGDNIGYGPNPQEVVGRLRQLGYTSVLGNHEFALADARARRWFNFQAAENNIATEKLLSQENRQYCCRLPTFLTYEKAHFVHAFPLDSVFRYLNRQSDEKIAALFASTTPCLFFVGHTHRLMLVTGNKGMISRKTMGQETVQLEPDNKYIVNCGSVGQPRDEDRRAKYLLWDYAARQLVVRFVEYDNRKTMQKIRDRGFPEIYAMRLA